MLKRTLLPLAALCLVLTVSCGPSFRHIKERTMTEAEYLQSEAIAKDLRSDEITLANAFLVKARETSKPRQSADYADLAAAYFRIALARQSLTESVNILQEAEAALTASREQVARYEQVLIGVRGQ